MYFRTALSVNRTSRLSAKGPCLLMPAPAGSFRSAGLASEGSGISWRSRANKTNYLYQRRATSRSPRWDLGRIGYPCA